MKFFPSKDFPYGGNIDNIHHCGYEANKCHPNQASIVPPAKIVNILH